MAEEDRNLSQVATAVGVDAAGSTNRFQNPDVSSERLRDLILQILDDGKAEDIVTIDLRGKTSIADYMVVCSGRSTRQVSTLADKVAEDLKTQLARLCKTEGKAQGDWVLIDAGDVIVHVFRPEVREFYQLEKMWMAPPARA